jgi:transcriptional regulator with XRE-family HTH domain
MATQKKKTPDTDFASRMKRLRKKSGFSFAQLSNDTGLTEEYLEQVENGDLMPTVSSIIQISKALTVDAGTFLDSDDPAAARKRKAEGLQKRQKAYSYKTLTPDAAHKHMKAFLVTIDPKSDLEGAQYQHEGEEFIYVLEGRLNIEVGQKISDLRKGQTLHFNSNIVHKLSNPGTKKTELLVVVYTP